MRNGEGKKYLINSEFAPFFQNNSKKNMMKALGLDGKLLL